MGGVAAPRLFLMETGRGKGIPKRIRSSLCCQASELGFPWEAQGKASRAIVLGA